MCSGYVNNPTTADSSCHWVCVPADPPGEDMYVYLGKNKAGLRLWRCKRGSSKNEAARSPGDRAEHEHHSQDEAADGHRSVTQKGRRG
jgi:hypothetical protein